MPEVGRPLTFVTRTIAPLFLLQVSAVVSADALPDTDNGPLTGIFGFPTSAERGEVVALGQTEWGTSLIVSSHNVEETLAGESLRLDGETTRLTLSYRYGLARNLDLSIEAPYVWHQSGSLDSIIDRWHDLFGFPDGARSIRDDDQLEFFYSDGQSNSLDMTSNADGFGDVRVLLGWQFSKSAQGGTSLRFGLKFPTGESKTFLGSGGTDVSLGIAGDITGLFGSAKLRGLYRVSVTYLGEPEQLADRYKDVVGQLSLGLGYLIHRNVDLGLQSRIRSAVYDSATRNLGAESVSLTFGADFRLSDRYRLVLSVGEDVRPDTAPDVSFQVALRYSHKT